MIGKIYSIYTPFYDIKSGNNLFKSRPALIIAQADTYDYIVLPVSKVSKKGNLDPYYDVEVDPGKYPNTSLACISYVRTHKQTVVNRSSIKSFICDLRKEYEDLYVEILSRREDFSDDISEQALK